MKLDNYIFLIIFIAFILSACSCDDPYLDKAYEVYENNLGGSELFEALSEEQKLLIKKTFDSNVYDDRRGKDIILGKPTNIRGLPTVSKNVQQVTEYRQPEKEVILRDWTKNTFIEFKRICDKTISEFSIDGLPEKHNSEKIWYLNLDLTLPEWDAYGDMYKYSNGKIQRAGRKSYYYSKDVTLINWTNDNDEKIKEIYHLDSTKLTKTEFVNDIQTENKFQKEFNSNDQPIKNTFYHGYGDALTISKISYEYDSLNRISKRIDNSDITYAGKPFSNSSYETLYTYNSIGLLDTRGGPNNLLGFNLKRLKYYYNFHIDKDGLLNVHKLICTSFQGPKKGHLCHYIFDKHSNLLYSSHHYLGGEHTSSYYKEYKYFE